MKLRAWHVAVLLSLALVAGIAAVIAKARSKSVVSQVVFSVGEVRAVHADVSLGGREVRGIRRMSDGDLVSTGTNGRARVRLDDGAMLAVDGNTRFRVAGKRITLEQGRIFVIGGPGARTEVALGRVTGTVAASSAAFEQRTGAKGSVYCAEGELALNAPGKQLLVASGQTATLDGTSVTVAPEKAFDDWTFGLAAPWTNDAAHSGAIPEVRARASADDPGTPLVVRAQHAAVEIEGELAVTRARTLLFNGGDGKGETALRMSLPEGAILRRVARKVGSEAAEAQLAIAYGSEQTSGARGVVEWGGNGLLRGDLGPIAAGETLELAIEYAEWLPIRSGRAAYRFPVASPQPQPIGEFSVDVDASRTETPFLSVNQGARVEGRKVRLRQTDVRPTADVSLELEPKVVRPGTARAYVVPGKAGEDPYLLVRTEVPESGASKLTLVLVLDSSMSIGAQALETERAVLDAVLEGLGPDDSLAVLAADQTVRALGPEAPAAVSDKFRTEVRAAAAGLRPGGASNLGLALQRAADLLDAPSRGKDAGSGMIVYVGDGRASVGESTADGLRRLVGRRTGGVPRLSAIAVGVNADPWSLAKLVEGAGSLYEVADPSDAGRASTALLEAALLPTLRDVELDLGATVDRVYPRASRAALSGSTISLVGRLRGALPTRVGLRYRDGSKQIDEQRLLYRTPVPRGADVEKRWAEARIQDLVARDDGIEAAVNVAREFGLLTPWTSYFFAPNAPKPSQVSFANREPSPERDGALALRLGLLRPLGSTLLEPEPRRSGGVSLAIAAEAALHRVLNQASNSVRACRDARAGVRPDLGRDVTIELTVDAGGRAIRIRVVARSAKLQDPVLERCIRGVVESLPYFAAGVPVSVSHELQLPELRAAKKTRCSGAAGVALPLRREIWRARDSFGSVDGFLLAAQGCELPRWRDRRAYLELVLERLNSPILAIQFASALQRAGEADAASFVRREAVRSVRLFAELEALQRLLLADEPPIDHELDRAYEKAQTDEQRLEVVRHFLELSPHSVLARRRLLSLLEAFGMREQLVNEVAKYRAEPVADAGLLAEAASSLRRLGFEDESRRVFGELIERAPRDPWTLAYVGDRLRAEGMFEEALSAYESLARAVPNEAAATLRLALAQAGLGRLDVATRLLDRVSQTGGRNDDGRVAELASVVRAVLLARARGEAQPQIATELERRLLQTPLPDVASVILVQSAPSEQPVEVRVRRERGEKLDQSADLDAGQVGVAVVRVERGDGPTRILLSRRREPGPSRPQRALVSALVLSEDRSPRLVTREVDVLRDGKPVEIRFDGETLL